MNKAQMILDLKSRIAHNEERVADHERRHGERFSRDPKMLCSIDSEMADWHKGKIVAFKLVIEMLEAA